MDILDIDEVLKDDSFCLIEENIQDDVTNILQQWKRSGPAGKFDTRTFTRPKRRSAQNLEPSFALTTKSDNHPINLQVGGLVTSMQRSFLQDTSPPNSILSSMDTSLDRMSNSLITSGDFTNVSFLQTPITDDIISAAQINDYNFEDMIKDRKALENLSLSGDSAIIKDSNIAQIDEMNYLSKTNSGNSTMQNSTESMASGINETFVMLNQTVTEVPKASPSNWNNIQEDLILNTSMNLVDSTHVVQTPSDPDTEDCNNLTFKLPEDLNSVITEKTNKDIWNKTFEKPSENKNSTRTIMNETFYKNLSEHLENNTFDLQKSDDCIESNENVENVNNLTFDDFKSPPIEMQCGLNVNDFQSTPHHNIAKKSVINQYTPSITSIIDEVNISPIVPVKETKRKECDISPPNQNVDQLEKYLDQLSTNFPSSEEQLKIFEVEKLLQEDGIEFECLENEDLFSQANNEEDFDDMLEKLGKSSVLEESIKMRESLDNIKKRHSLAQSEKHHDNTPKHNDNLETYRIPTDSMVKSSLSSSGSSERLLSRRSRLYDDIQVVKPEILPTETLTDETNQKVIAKTDNDVMKNKGNIESKTETSSSNVNELSENAEVKEKSSEKTRDRERFKTIRIFKKSTDNEINVPCIDNELVNNQIVPQLPYTDETRFSKKNVNSPSTKLINNEMQQQNIYTTYKKPKGSLKMPVAVADIRDENNGKQRSLSRPTNFGKLSLNDPLPKANSASDLHTTLNPQRKQSNFGTNDKTTNIISPMGTKAKSFNNLAGQFGFSSKPPSIKPNSQSSLAQPANGTSYKNEKIPQNRSSLLIRPTSIRPPSDGVVKNEKTAFKAPHPISNLRAPNSRRIGLVRPSSGYYSNIAVKNEFDNNTGRLSPSNSLSSASSKGSIPECPAKGVNGYTNENDSTNYVETLHNECENVHVGQSKALPVKTGIPKPSGLRPPSNIRRSGLPRPSSIIKR